LGQGQIGQWCNCADFWEHGPVPAWNVADGWGRGRPWHDDSGPGDAIVVVVHAAARHRPVTIYAHDADASWSAADNAAQWGGSYAALLRQP
jgi:hypothetical protein